MSFLAQLRQKQNPVVKGGLQLCYLLSWQDEVRISGLYFRGRSISVKAKDITGHFYACSEKKF
jgi:hypothetical protein